MTRKEEREFLFNKTNGRCAYCGCELPERWHADHMKPVVRKLEYDAVKKTVRSTNGMYRPELDTLDNKIASCPGCNIRKGCGDVESFRADIMNCIPALNERAAQYKLAKKYGHIQETVKPVVFYFETLSTDGENV